MYDFRARSRGPVAGMVLLLATGCVGNIGSAPSPTGPPTTGAAGSGLGAGGGAAAGTTPIPTPPIGSTNNACAAPSVAPTVSRLLTGWEYRNAVVDLLGADADLPAFPPQPSNTGFDNEAGRTSVAAAHVEAYKTAAEAVARTAVDKANLSRVLGGCDPGTAGDDACLTKFLSGFARRAYRRPLADEDTTVLRKVFDAGKQTDFATGVQLMITALLQSPQFLYRIEAPPPAAAPARATPSELATRLAFLVWGGPPDAALLDAAAANKLSTKEEIAAQLARMLGDTGTQTSRARSTFTHFTSQWLELDQIAKAEKDTTVFKTWKPEHLALWRGETERFLDHLVWAGEGDLATMFGAKYTFVDETLGRLYGFANPPKNTNGTPTFAKVAVDGTTRGGLLTHAGLLAMMSHANQTSPVLRGKFVRERLMCDVLPPPPAGLVIELPALDPNQTTRQRFTVHKEKDACRGCHQMMDPLGLGLERYDAVGAYRDMEAGTTVDDSGEIVGLDDGAFRGVMQLQQKLAASAPVQDCVVRQFFRFAIGRIENDKLDACTLQTLSARFKSSGFKFKELISAITETDAFLYKSAAPVGGGK